MKKYRRTRKACTLDNQARLSDMAEQKPSGAAARQMIHRAYQSYTVDGYCRAKGRQDLES